MKYRSLKSVACVTAAVWMYAAIASAGTYKNITIDGDFGDWTGVPLLHTSPTNNNPNVVDYQDIYAANDENYLYIRFTLHTAANPFTFLQNIFVDADNDGLTGFGAGGYIGSELLIQEGTGYQEKNGIFNAGTVTNLSWAAAPSGSGTNFEARISRAARNTSDGLLVFTNDTIAFVLEAEISFNPTEWAPALVGGITYAFEAPPAPLTTNLTLRALTDSWQVNDAGADLGTAWLDSSYDDTGAGWSAGQAMFGYTPSPGAYPPINKALAPSPNTYYFRTHFDWNFLPDNLAFVVTNRLSDGAVLYLNGQEVRRVRMPAGAIGFATSATGAASPVGVVEVFGISGQALVLGDNILEVETHQAAGTATDMMLGLTLTAAAQLPVLNVNTNLPANQSVVAGAAATLTTDVIGSGPLHRQWMKNGTPLLGATNASLTIPVVLTNDAGNYVLVTSNPTSTNTTRTAVLTVTSTPVTFNDPAQPADAYTLEGQPLTLAVTVSGSPVIHFQWFKGVTSILNATNATYTIANPVLTDSGSYRVTVTNPSGATNSRSATVTVLRDNVPPAITAVAASANQIVVTFSAPVDAATANVASKYTLTGGLTVSSAVLNPGPGTQVTLTTSGAMTLGTVYQLTVNGVTDLFGNAARQSAAFSRSITIDGNFADWQGIAPLYSGPIGGAGAADFKDIYLYSDSSRYYFQVTLWQDIPPGDGQFPFYVNMFFDSDNDALTGYSVFGSELLIQSGFSYQQKNGGFNEGPINGLDWTSLPAVPGTNFEFSVSRAATFASDSTAVFPTNVLNFLFQGMTPGFVVVNTAPASGVISFTNTPVVNVPPLSLGALGVQTVVGGKVALAWDGSHTLQARGTVSGGSWTNVPAATSPYVAPATGSQLYFRLTN